MYVDEPKEPRAPRDQCAVRLFTISPFRLESREMLTYGSSSPRSYELSRYDPLPVMLTFQASVMRLADRPPENDSYEVEDSPFMLPLKRTRNTQ